MFCAVLFAVSIYLGIWLFQTPVGAKGSENIIRQFVDILGPLGLLTAPQLMLIIFLNNSIKALLVIVLGYTLGIPPFIFLVVNGLLVGVVLGATSAVAGPWAAVPGLVPHGIIEVPALLLASALGFRVALAVIRRILGRPAQPGRELKIGLAIYAKVILPALLVASAIEAFVTPMVMGK